MVSSTRLGRRLGLVAACAALLGVLATPSAQALGSGKFPWRADDANRTIKYFYGSGGIDGRMVYATTNAPGTACLLYVKRVKARISLPNGSTASRSSLLGQCSTGVEISPGSYSVFQIKSTHTLEKWSGTTYSYVL